MMKKLLLLGLLGLSLCLPNQPATAEEPLLLVTPGILPISYEENGAVKGIGTDLMIEAFARLGQPIDIQIFPTARTQEMIKEGSADAIFVLAKTPEREIFADYPNEPVIDQPVVLFVRKDSEIRFDGDLKNLSSYTFGVIRGGRYSSDFEAAVKNQVITKLDEVSGYRQNILKLIDQRIDIIIGPRISILFEAKQIGKQEALKELLPPLTASSPAYLAFSKKGKATGLIAQFDAVMKDMREDGTYDRIMQSYLK